MSARPPARLTLGPLLFHWAAGTRRDFCLRFADEAAIDTVYVGEVVCAKREAGAERDREMIVQRLQAAGKEVVLSTLALVTTRRDVEAIRAQAANGLMLEANDVACVQLLAGAPFVVGPYINVLNEGARDVLVGCGATRIVLPVEVPATSIGIVAATAGRTEIEVQVFGRQPLSVAMRCYHARAHHRTKDHCQLVCGLDRDGLTAQTIDGVDILAVNGTQTLTHGYAVLLADLAALRDAGVTHFRLSPHTTDMVRVAALYRDVLDGRREATEAVATLRSLVGAAPFINGFLHGREGLAWVGQPAAGPGAS
jgi:collagenase-like PrtC family protease